MALYAEEVQVTDQLHCYTLQKKFNLVLGVEKLEERTLAANMELAASV